MAYLLYGYADALDSRTFFFRGSKLGFLTGMFWKGGKSNSSSCLTRLLVGGFNPI